MADMEQCREVFKANDKDKKGVASCGTLKELFAKKNAEFWTEERIEAMLKLVDPTHGESIDYNALLDWAANKVQLIGAEFVANPDDKELDLKETVTKEQLVDIMKKLDLASHTAERLYDLEEQTMITFGKEVGDGLPIKSFFAEFGIDRNDKAELRHLAEVVCEVKEGRGGGDGGDYQVLTNLDRLMREIKRKDKSIDEAWEVLTQTEEISEGSRAKMMEEYEHNKAGLVEKMRELTISPPVLPSNAGAVGNRERCMRKVDEIIAECKKNGTKYTDPDFDLTKDLNACLYVDKKQPGFDCTVGVPAGIKRISEMCKEPALFKGGITASDIKQGNLGTCFLLGACGAVAANRKDVIRTLFVNYDMEVGVYGIRACVDDEWVHVIVDDWMPLDKKGRLMYAKCHDKEEFWVSILEKAYCKLHTCYEMCDGGKAMQAIYALCGGYANKFPITDAHRKDPSSYFKLLQAAKDDGCLLTTTFVADKNAAKTVGKCGEAVLPTGLVGGHVYSVLQTIEAEGVQLIQCRNPWGSGEWTGKYSDDNKHGEWTPALIEATGWVSENDGTFWLCAQDFVENSGGVEYAKTFGPLWKRVMHETKFQQGTVKATATWAKAAKAAGELSFEKGDMIEVKSVNSGWWNGNVVGKPEKKGLFPSNYVKIVDKPVACFHLVGTPNEGCTAISIVIMMSQPTIQMQRKFTKRPDGKNYKDVKYPGMIFCVLDMVGNVVLKREGDHRCISGELLLPGNTTYKVYALSLEGDHSPFKVTAFMKDGIATLTEVFGARISEVIPSLK